MYLNDWSESQAEGMCRDFEIYVSTLDGIKILVASYTYEDYNGSAFVLFEKGGKLFEVNGSHCSCYGLEGQWEPEETTLEALMARKPWHWDGHGNGFIGIIKQALQK
jgi:hypothetical protein